MQLPGGSNGSYRRVRVLPEGTEKDGLQKERRQRGGAGVRFEWGCNCVLFYASIGYCMVHLLCMLLRIGPFAPWQPPELHVTRELREREEVTTKTKPPFKILVHPGAEDRFISLELQQYGIWEKPLHERILKVLNAAGPKSNATLLDIGANIGFHTLAAAAAGYKAVAVEPLAEILESQNFVTLYSSNIPI
jgi:hypothetical protein